jgi:hypothetical protein
MELLLASMKLCANGNVFQQKERVEWRIIDHRTGGKEEGGNIYLPDGSSNKNP